MAFAPVFSLKRGHRTPDGGTDFGTYLRTGWILRRAALVSGNYIGQGWGSNLQNRVVADARPLRSHSTISTWEGSYWRLMVDRKLLEAEQGDPVYTLAQVRASTVILRLDAEHNESVTRFLIDSGLAVRSEHSIRLLRGIPLSHATLSDAHLITEVGRGQDLTVQDLPAEVGATQIGIGQVGIANEELEQQ